MSWKGAVVGRLGALGDGDAALDGVRGRTAFAAAPAPFGFGPGKVVPPGTVVGSADLGMSALSGRRPLLAKLRIFSAAVRLSFFLSLPQLRAFRPIHGISRGDS